MFFCMYWMIVETILLSFSKLTQSACEPTWSSLALCCFLSFEIYCLRLHLTQQIICKQPPTLTLIWCKIDDSSQLVSNTLNFINITKLTQLCSKWYQLNVKTWVLESRIRLQCWCQEPRIMWTDTVRYPDRLFGLSLHDCSNQALQHNPTTELITSDLLILHQKLDSRCSVIFKQIMLCTEFWHVNVELSHIATVRSKTWS